VIDPLKPNQVFAALLDQGLYRSANGGEAGTRQKLKNGLPVAGFRRVALANGPPLVASTNTTLSAAFSSAANRNLLGLYNSTDGGASWNQVTTPQLPGQADYNLALAVDPLDANIVYYGTSTNSQLSGSHLHQASRIRFRVSGTLRPSLLAETLSHRRSNSNSREKRCPEPPKRRVREAALN
jgi:hypothetical protein